MFDIDRQTLYDLSINKVGQDESVLKLFQPVTIGGMVKLQELADAPLTTASDIQRRLDAIRFLETHPVKISFNKEELDFIEFYLKQTVRSSNLSYGKAYKQYVFNLIRTSNDCYVINRGVSLFYKLIKTLTAFFDVVKLPDGLFEIKNNLTEFSALLPNQPKKNGYNFDANPRFIEELDHLFRYQGKFAAINIIQSVYLLDVYSAVGAVANVKGFCYPDVC